MGFLDTVIDRSAVVGKGHRGFEEQFGDADGCVFLLLFKKFLCLCYVPSQFLCIMLRLLQNRICIACTTVLEGLDRPRHPLADPVSLLLGNAYRRIKKEILMFR